MPYSTNSLFYTRSQTIPKDKVKSAHSPSSSSTSSSSEGPETPGPSPPSSPIATADPKDVRSYEHQRQRARHATDFAKMRARRGQWSSKLDDPPKDTSSGKLSNWAVREADSPSDHEGGFLFDFEPDAGPRVAVGSYLEVPLAALVTTKKPRKGREGDFEIIPHVRPVIALDDDMAPDVEVDEPWEHIYGDDDDRPDKEPSYATIASLN